MIENDNSSEGEKNSPLYIEYDKEPGTQKSIYSLVLYVDHKFIRGKIQVMTNNDR